MLSRMTIGYASQCWKIEKEGGYIHKCFRKNIIPNYRVVNRTEEEQQNNGIMLTVDKKVDLLLKERSRLSSLRRIFFDVVYS